MNELKVITSKIISDAEGYARDVMQNCLEQCKNISESEAERCKRLCLVETEKCESKCQSIKERAKSAAELAERDIFLRAKNENRQLVLKLASEKILSDEESYFNFLIKKINSATQFLKKKFDFADSEIFEIFLCERDKKKFEFKMKKILEINDPEIKISESDEEFSGGFVLRRGDIFLNCTLETLLAEKLGECGI